MELTGSGSTFKDVDSLSNIKASFAIVARCAAEQVNREFTILHVFIILTIISVNHSSFQLQPFFFIADKGYYVINILCYNKTDVKQSSLLFYSNLF